MYRLQAYCKGVEQYAFKMFFMSSKTGLIRHIYLEIQSKSKKNVQLTKFLFLFLFLFLFFFFGVKYELAFVKS